MLCHGLANNHRIFEFLSPQNLPQFLSKLGFEVFSVDLRGCGGARPPHEGPLDASIDDFIERDVPAIVDAVLKASGASRVFWVGHSMGGMVALGALPVRPGLVAGLCTIGTPVFFDRNPLFLVALWFARFLGPWGSVPVEWLSELAAPFGGRVDVQAARISVNLDNVTGPALRQVMASIMAPIWLGVARQLRLFVGQNRFQSMQGEDYRARVAGSRFPLLIVGGSVDHIAPESVQQQLFALSQAEDKTLHLMGRAHQHQTDYGHGDLLFGTHAPTEVYPRIGTWLTRRATPL